MRSAPERAGVRLEVGALELDDDWTTTVNGIGQLVRGHGWRRLEGAGFDESLSPVKLPLFLKESDA